MSDRRREDDWARQVPWERPHTPYRDYGWEPGESVLPEFRDPSVHVMPYEEREVRPWRVRNQDYTLAKDWMKRGPHTGKGPKGYKRSDERIRDDVMERLTQHGWVDARQVQVEVHDGEVTLNGTIGSREEKRMAEDAVDSIPGVKDVHNNLKIEQASNRRDYVGRSGVYPASGPWPQENAPVQGEASWGQGERGAAGYEDSGRSELPLYGEDMPRPRRRRNR